MSASEHSLRKSQEHSEGEVASRRNDSRCAQGYEGAHFCVQCSAFTLADFVKPRLSQKTAHQLLRIVQGSTCPMCLFFDAVLNAREISSVVSNTTRIVFIWSSEPFELRHIITLMIPWRKLTKTRFLLPLTQDRNGLLRRERRPRGRKRLELDKVYEPISPDTIDIELIKTWLKDCREKHIDVCPEPEPELLAGISALPSFRVIDCVRRTIVVPPAVFEYVALSYVWGPAPASEVKDVCTSRQSTRVLPLVLPKTIEDAIKVALQLDITYLWVDKYCIDQSTDQHDLLVQLSSMDMVYKGATVTVVAAAGSDAEFGLPGVSARRQYNNSITDGGQIWFSGPRDMRTHVLKSKWITRGWTYQEAHFSRRLLTFTDEQVLFECNHCRRCESMRLRMEDIADHSYDVFGLEPGVARSTLRLRDHVELYTQRDLTNQSDALNGLTGLFASFSRKEESMQQYWGIPMQLAGYEGRSYLTETLSQLTAQSTTQFTLAHGLTWDVARTKRLIRRHGFPSWSWSGWTGPISWHNFRDMYRKDSVRLVQIRFDAVKKDGTTENLTEQLAQNVFEDTNNEASLYTYFLHIEAEILEIELGARHRWPYGSDDHEFTVGTSYVIWSLDLTSPETISRDLYLVIKQQTFDCVVLNDWCGLVVWTRNGNNERLGLIGLEGMESKSWKYTEPRVSMDLRRHFPGRRRTIVLG